MLIYLFGAQVQQLIKVHTAEGEFTESTFLFDFSSVVSLVDMR